MDSKGEIIEAQPVEAEDLYPPTGAEIIRPFDPKKIDIQTKQMILEAIFRRLKNGEIEMKTGFQRRSDLWDGTKQSRLIESILIRFPLPAFYFDGTNDDKWLVVDGLQRLSTFDNFVVQKKMRLQGLEYLNQFNGKTFDQLPRDLQRRIEEHEITVYIINPGTPAEVKYNIFRRINTGGLVLEPAEIRHALNQGQAANFVAELAGYPEFKQATGGSIPTERMLDRDFVTRFLAFYLHDPSGYKGNLEDFLNSVMAELQKVLPAELDRIRRDFKAAMKTAKAVFGSHAFRKKYDTRDRRHKPINKALFETWAVLLAKLSDNERAMLQAKNYRVQKAFVDACVNDKDFERSISVGTGEKRNVAKRFEIIETIIRDALKND